MWGRESIKSFRISKQSDFINISCLWINICNGPCSQVHTYRHRHTHHRVFISLWGHLTDIMCSLDAYPNPNHQKLMPNPNPQPKPNHNRIANLSVKPHFESRKCLQTHGDRCFVPIRAGGPHRYSNIQIFGPHKHI